MTVRRRGPKLTNAEYLRELRAKAVANGKCGECRMRDREPDKKTCRVCLDKHAKARIDNRDRERCDCGAKRRPGRKTCERCAGDAARHGAKRRQRAIDNNLCTRCRKSPPEAGRRCCASCLERYSEEMRDKRVGFLAAGRCGVCGTADLETKTRCTKCLENARLSRKRGRERRANGIPPRQHTWRAARVRGAAGLPVARMVSTGSSVLDASPG